MSSCFLLNKRTCLLVQQEDMSYFSTTRHDVLLNEKTGLLVQMEAAGPQGNALAGVRAKMPWAPWHFSKAPFCHVHLFAMSLMALFKPFCHGSPGIVHTFLLWLPWYLSMPRTSKWDNAETRSGHKDLLSDHAQSYPSQCRAREIFQLLPQCQMLLTLGIY